MGRRYEDDFRPKVLISQNFEWVTQSFFFVENKNIFIESIKSVIV